MLCNRATTTAKVNYSVRSRPILLTHSSFSSVRPSNWIRTMADVRSSVPHLERTAGDPRQTGLYRANISRVELVNKKIRLIRLSLQKDGPPLRHLPGQYVDLHIPDVSVVGGFTIVSPPQTAIHRPLARTPVDDDDDSSSTAASAAGATNDSEKMSEDASSEYPCIDIAIQKAPQNPPAAHLWREPPSSLLDEPVTLKVGGKFTYPPPTLSMAEFRRITNVVLVAGGVGINPIMSMVGAMDLLGPGRLGGMVPRVRILYSSKRPDSHNSSEQKEGEILFDDALRRIAEKYKNHAHVDLEYRLYETGQSTTAVGGPRQERPHRRDGATQRIARGDLLDAVGDVEMRQKTLVYVCGVPQMTDEFVALLRGMEGLDENRVLCEKWW